MNEELHTLNLVKHYFNICNTALLHRKDKLVFGPALAVLNQLASGDTVVLRVVDDPGAVLGCYTTRFIDSEFTPIEEGQQDDPDTGFTLQRSFLEEVVQHSDYYIEHPQKLDWSWLKEA
ncbi:MAG: hypothetical protein RQ736_08520 [Thiogranum sp.]|nr:hypothetical protein [Thiogranum sp.]